MYRLNRLRPLLSAAAAAAYPKRSLRLNPLLRAFASRHFSRRASNPAGIDDFGNNGEVKNEYERKMLPPEFHSRNVVMLTCDSTAHGGICDVYLIGTRHNTKIVFLELCSQRKGALEAEDGVDGEFSVANTEARKYGGKIILGDRPIDITMNRAWAKTPLWGKFLFVPFFQSYGIFSPSSEYCKLVDRLEDLVGEDRINGMTHRAILVLQFLLPTFIEVLVHERDQYMSAKLLEVAREHNTVVAVVGKGHLAGIRENWKQPVDMEELLRMPTGMSTIITPKFVYRVAQIGGIGVISGLIYLSIKML